MRLKTEILKEMDLPYSAIEDTIIGNGRWTNHHRIIFEYEGKHYRATYAVGATEMQNERPWDYESEVECTPVAQVEKVVKVWEPISE